MTTDPGRANSGATSRAHGSGHDGTTQQDPVTELAAPQVTGKDIGAHFAQRIWLLGWALASTGLAALSLVLFVVATFSIPLVIVWVGIPMLFGSTLAIRPLAGIHRSKAGQLLGREIDAPYLRRSDGNLLVRVRDLMAERATWRDFAWVAVNGTIGLALSIVAILEAVLDLLFWWLPPGMMLRVHAYLAAAFLAPTDATTLAQRVQQLADTRAETRASSATELRRIERDLHDGAQARLVSLGISLGMAEEQVMRNPQGAQALISDAREASRVALEELRDLVRGIHPPVLSDRGLVGAITALALMSPIPIEVRGELAGRLSTPVESAGYFVVAEAVANIIKHSGATTASITVEQRPGALRLHVYDDGRGGADETRGTGLHGIRRRLAAFDGVLSISSHAGGPTELTMTIPYEA